MSKKQASLLVAGILVVGFLVTTGCSGQDPDLSGAWKLSSPAWDKDLEFVLHLVHSGDTVTGFVEDSRDKYRITEGRYSRKKVSFKYEIPGEGEVEWSFALQNSNTMQGIATTWEHGREGQQIEVKATRNQ